ncbi:MAG TPA: hypothetical protein PKA00_22970, partial [Saprospiraceae bacterium]|nr:hypothetical protein [Saprospiraceae bacterium]HMQ85791.1 hypothetical protein [Saprospiraceae bacterium]
MFSTTQAVAQINSFQGTVIINDGVNPPNEENYPWTLFSFDRAALNTFLKTQGPNAQFVFQVGQNHAWSINLEENPIPGSSRNNTYLGYADGQAEHTARWYVGNKVFSGRIIEGNVMYEIIPAYQLVNDLSNDHYFLFEKPAPDFAVNQILPQSLDDNPDAAIELGIMIDYDSYLIFGEDEELAIEHYEGCFYEVYSFFNADFEILFVQRGPFVFTQDDNVGYLADVERKWNNNFYCAPADIVCFINEGNDIAGHGSSDGELCTSFGSFIVDLSDFFGDQSCAAASLLLAHELGHNLTGEDHTDDYVGCSDINCDACYVPAPVAYGKYELMCDGGGDSEILFDAFLCNCTVDLIANRLNLFCLDDIRPAQEPPCPDCIFFLDAAVDKKEVITACGDQDNLVNAVFELSNACDTGTFRIDIRQTDAAAFPVVSHDVEYAPEPDLEFEIENESPSIRHLVLDEVFMEFGASMALEVSNLAYASASSFVEKNTSTITIYRVIHHHDDFQNMWITYYDFITSQELSTNIIEAQDFQHVSGSLEQSIEDGNVSYPFGCDANGAQKLRIQGAYEIDLSNYDDDCYAFPSGSALLMEPGAELIIKNGTTLVLDDVPILSCYEMWEGITVEGGAELQMSNSRITNAEQAVTLLTGSRATLHGNTFNKNYIGLLINPTISSNPNINLYNCYGNSFIGGPLLTPRAGQNSYAGVWVYKSWIFMGASGEVPNVFSSLGVGILGYDASMLLTNTHFENIKFSTTSVGPNGRGILMYGSLNTYPLLYIPGNETVSFDACNTGIEALGMGVVVANTIMDRVNVGIHLANCQNKSLRLWNNSIFADQIGISAVMNNPVYASYSQNFIKINNEGIAGFSIQDDAYDADDDFNRYVLRFNDITMMGSGNGIQIGTGRNIQLHRNTAILMSEAGEACLSMEGNQKSWVRCNNFVGASTGTGIGLYSVGAYESILNCNTSYQTFRGFNFEGMGDLVQLRGNTFLSHSIGLRISPDGIIGTQRYQGNKWCGEYLNGMAAVHEGEDEIISQSLFYVDPNLPSLDGCALLPAVQASGDWFFLQGPGQGESTYLCLSENEGACDLDLPGPPPTGEEEDEVVHPLVNGNLGTGIYETPLLWTGRRHLYSRWAGQSGLESWKQDFVDAQALGSIGAFHEVDNTTKQAIKPSGLERKQLIEGLEVQLILADSLLRLDSMYNAGSGEQAEAILLQRSQILEQLRQQELLLTPLLNSLASERQQLTNQALQANQAIGISQIFELNEKRVNAFLLKKWAKGNVFFSQAEANGLWQIASQCPQAGGDAVFKARSLYRLIDPLAQFDNNLLCGVSHALTQPKQDKVEIPQTYRLYPNPARDAVVLERLQALEQEVAVSVYDLYGRLRLE